MSAIGSTGILHTAQSSGDDQALCVCIQEVNVYTT